MNTKDIIFELRTKNGLPQDELAEKVTWMILSKSAFLTWSRRAFQRNRLVPE